jgi:hypothetical protein
MLAGIAYREVVNNGLGRGDQMQVSPCAHPSHPNHHLSGCRRGKSRHPVLPQPRQSKVLWMRSMEPVRRETSCRGDAARAP